MIFDLSLGNEKLYKGCEIEEVSGRLSLKTSPSEAANIIGKNAANEIEQIDSRDEITLTGAAPVWVYLIVFHLVVHRFDRVYYHDGKGRRVLIAAHG